MSGLDEGRDEVVGSGVGNGLGGGREVESDKPGAARAGVATIGRYPDLASAKLAQSILDAAGIAATVPDEGMAGLDWRLVPGLGGVRLQVAAEDAEAAAELLAVDHPPDATEVDEMAGDAAPATDRDACPACGSAVVAPGRLRRRAKALTMLLFPFLLVVWPLIALVPRRLVCASCGHRWRPRGGPLR